MQSKGFKRSVYAAGQALESEKPQVNFSAKQATATSEPDYAFQRSDITLPPSSTAAVPQRGNHRTSLLSHTASEDNWIS